LKKLATLIVATSKQMRKIQAPEQRQLDEPEVCQFGQLHKASKWGPINHTATSISLILRNIY
jgi:hypothetical protein